jgi:hypothetical protein
MASPVPSFRMNEHALLLLRIVHARGSVTPLLESGLTYWQISQLMSELIETGYISITGGTPTVTPSGTSLILADAPVHERRPGGGFISPLFVARRERIPVHAVYLPPLKNSFF